MIETGNEPSCDMTFSLEISSYERTRCSLIILSFFFLFFITMKTTTSYLNLEKVVQIYGRQPELLELILSSKVEEDKRRAEEAKLRRKEIDYMLQQKTLPSISKTLPPPPVKNRKNSIDMLLSPPPFDLKLPEIQNKKRSFSTINIQDLPAGSAPPSPPSESFETNKRKRREMQAITTIIETKAFPYNDDYLWKNNGNTIHKNSGYKSIYYKCSNSAKVNQNKHFVITCQMFNRIFNRAVQ